jgi:hypothetical protein
MTLVTGATAVYLHHFTIDGGVGKLGGALYLDALRGHPAAAAFTVLQGITLKAGPCTPFPFQLNCLPFLSLSPLVATRFTLLITAKTVILS